MGAIFSHISCQKNGHGNSCKRADQRACQRVFHLCYLCRQEIYAHSIKDGFRTAHHDGGDHTNPGIRSIIFEDIQHQAGGGR